MKTHSRSLKSRKQTHKRKTRKTQKAGKCKHNCRLKECGHTPFLYGGNGPNDFQKLDDLGQNLAYTGEKVPVISPNPHFAYTGKGGSGINKGVEGSDLSRAYPIVNNQYVPGNPTVNWLNSNTMSGGKRVRRRKMRGGGCGCNANNNAYGSLAYVPGQKGGQCGMCSASSQPSAFGQPSALQTGGSFYKDPLPYPNGLVGTAWTPKISSWPGVDGVSGDSNYYPLNTYSPVDISREMIATGASKPFISGGGKTRKMKRRLYKKGGGWYTNSFAQDFVNLGRSTFYNANSALNALKGVPAPTNPLPWKDQLK